MIVVRPARLDDYDALVDLAELSGAGFTSLPVDESILRKRLTDSVAAFLGEGKAALQGKFLMMLEDVESGEIVGASAVKAGVGVEKPFFNYRLLTIAQSSSSADRRFDMDVLVLVNEYSGHTEVGTLFIKDAWRGGGTGRLAAQARYLLMAAAPERFGQMVLAELRGVVDEGGFSPFWEGVGRRFFHMGFQEADHLSAVSDNQFILDLMPKYPIYVDLLDEPARDAIGKTHPQGVGARKLLEWEGFSFDRVVVIFDGGPLMSAPRGSIRTIRESRRVTVVDGDTSRGRHLDALVSTDRLTDFRVVKAEIEMAGDSARMSNGVLNALGLSSGEPARVWIREQS